MCVYVYNAVDLRRMNFEFARLLLNCIVSSLNLVPVRHVDAKCIANLWITNS